MKNLSFIILFFIPTLLSAQSFTNLPSIAGLESEIILGTEREKHISMRIQALGRDFSGYIPDQLTDLYRNPAYFGRLDSPVLWGDLDRRRNGSFRGSSPPFGGRLGYAKRIGLLLHGNFADS